MAHLKVGEETKIQKGGNEERGRRKRNGEKEPDLLLHCIKKGERVVQAEGKQGKN